VQFAVLIKSPAASTLELVVWGAGFSAVALIGTMILRHLDPPWAANPHRRKPKRSGHPAHAK
jgi:hypothetical protein